MGNPNKFLEHIKNNVLSDHGYIYIEVPDINNTHFSDPTHCFTYGKESLKYVLEKNDFEVLLIEVHNIYGYVDENIPRKKLQKNIHCLAKKGGLNKFIEYPNQGLKIYNQSKNTHSKIFNLYLFKKLKKLIVQVSDLFLECISRIISFFSHNVSINVYDKYKFYVYKFLKKFKK